MELGNRFLTIMTIGAVGGIIYTVIRNPGGITAFFHGLDVLYTDALGGTLGKTRNVP